MNTINMQTSDRTNEVATPLASQQLLQLLTLASSNLPIGSYCYSQGLESAIETGIVHDEQSCQDYLSDALHLILGSYELPLLLQMLNAHEHNQLEHVSQLGQHYRASRESQELLLETTQLAHAFRSWIVKVIDTLPTLHSKVEYGFLPLFAELAHHLQIPHQSVLTAYGFMQLENQVLAAVKTVPLGQTSGQRILWSLQTELSSVVADCLTEQTPLSSSLPGLAILSSQHETQYSRLYRS